MTIDRDRLEAELTQAFERYRRGLVRWIERAFPSLRPEAEDIVQEAITETLRRVRGEGFCPQAGWVGWLRRVARNRAIDRLRSWERRVFTRLATSSRCDPSSQAAGGAEAAADSAPGPATRMAEAERHRRQGLLLSQVLEEFTRWCEARPERLAVKECYERSLRGQTPAQIAAAMDRKPEEVYHLLNRARQWVLGRIRQADVDRSVFLTLHRRKPE